MIPGVNLARNAAQFLGLLLDELGRVLHPTPTPSRVVVDEISLPGLPEHRASVTPIPARDERTADA